MMTPPLYHMTDSPWLARIDPTRRVWGWSIMAGRADHWARELDRGRPIFFFDKEYQIPSLLRFYGEGHPLAVSLQSRTHRDQYFFLLDQESMKGSDAIAVLESVRDSYTWRMEKSFRKVTFLEEFPVMRGNVELHRLYFFHCKHFKGWEY